VANSDIIVFEITQEHLKDLLQDYPELLGELAEVVAERTVSLKTDLDDGEKDELVVHEKKRILEVAHAELELLADLAIYVAPKNEK